MHKVCDRLSWILYTEIIICIYWVKGSPYDW